MSSFKFNFGGDSNNIQDKDDAEKISWLESEEIKPKIIQNYDETVSRAKMFTCGDLEIGHVDNSDVILTMDSENNKNSIQLAEKMHSDLVAGTYEGGLKIWECTNDLIEYLLDNKDTIKLKDTKVLDLGCGVGILGIYAFMEGSRVTFQDYNKEVLESVTIPNVFLNIEEQQKELEITDCKFYSGDWASFSQLLEDSIEYDLILTSETIYNTLNYDKLISLFLKRLKKDGIVLVAAKTYYFGVGGGTRQFEQSIEKNRQLECNVCWKSSGGIQREILRIKRKT